MIKMFTDRRTDARPHSIIRAELDDEHNWLNENL